MSTPATDFERTAFDRTHERPARPREMESVSGLFRRLADDVTDLFAQELALFKTETMGAIGDVRMAVGSLATGGAVVFAGFIFLLLAAFLGLTNIVEPWLSALIVGGVTLIAGLILTATGKRKLEPAAFRPRHTERSLQKDRDMIKGARHHEEH